MKPRPRHFRAMHRMLVVLPACLASGAMGQAGPPLGNAHAAALQACPKVSHEIVDLDMLAEGLKNSSAVGLFEKVRLKSSIDELVGRLKAFHAGARSYSLAQLQEQYDLLLMRIASQLQDKDLALHRRLCNAWESLWAQLQDGDRFREKFS